MHDKNLDCDGLIGEMMGSTAWARTPAPLQMPHAVKDHDGYYLVCTINDDYFNQVRKILAHAGIPFYSFGGDLGMEGIIVPHRFVKRAERVLRRAARHHVAGDF